MSKLTNLPRALAAALLLLATLAPAASAGPSGPCDGIDPVCMVGQWVCFDDPLLPRNPYSCAGSGWEIPTPARVLPDTAMDA